MLETRGADDRRGDVGLGQHPSERHLRHGDAAGLGDLLDDVDDLPIGLRVKPVGVHVGVRANRRAFGLRAGTRQHAASERRPRNEPEPLGVAKRNHLPLFFAIQQVVLRLHRDEPRPPIALGDAQRAHQLPGVPGAGADVAHFPLSNELLERAERLLDRHGVVEAMDLIEVDGLDAEPPQAALARLHDVLARQALPVRRVAHRPEHLRRDDDLVEIRHRPKRAPGHFFAHRRASTCRPCRRS